MISTSLLRPLALASLLAACATAHAALTVYTTPAGFAGATALPGVDTFNNLSVSSITLGPLSRSAGPYGYSASSPGDFYGGGGANPFLAPNNALDSITFTGFAPSVRGFAGNFFGSTLAGAFALGTVTLQVTDSLGATSTQNVAATSFTTGSFLGFVSNASLVSVVLTAVQPGGPDFLWPSVDNLTLAVPEPATYGLLLAGLAAVSLAARRRS